MLKGPCDYTGRIARGSVVMRMRAFVARVHPTVVEGSFATHASCHPPTSSLSSINLSFSCTFHLIFIIFPLRALQFPFLSFTRVAYPFFQKRQSGSQLSWRYSSVWLVPVVQAVLLAAAAASTCQPQPLSCSFLPCRLARHVGSQVTLCVNNMFASRWRPRAGELAMETGRPQLTKDCNAFCLATVASIFVLRAWCLVRLRARAWRPLQNSCPGTRDGCFRKRWHGGSKETETK